MLQPPSEALGMLIGTMSQNQALRRSSSPRTSTIRPPMGTASRRPSASRPGSSGARRRPRRPVRGHGVRGMRMQRADPLAFRHAASRFATGVAVLTALDSAARSAA